MGVGKNDAQESGFYYFPSLRYLQGYVWPAPTDSMESPNSAMMADRPVQRAFSDPALSEFGRRASSTAQEGSATYPAFATLLAAANSSGGRVVNDGYRYSLRDSRVASDEREVIPIDKHTGVAGASGLHLPSHSPHANDEYYSGRDRTNVVHELNRLRNAKVSAKRRRLAALTGVTSIVVAGGTGYMYADSAFFGIFQADPPCRIVCDIISLIREASILPASSQDRLRIGLLIANLSARSISFVGICIVIIWCRYARRPSSLARPVLLSALLSFVLQIMLGLFNILLVLIWRSSSIPARNVSERCTWGIDILWQLGDSGKQCPGQSLTGDQVPWIVAGSIRLLAVLLAGVSPSLEKRL